MADGGLDTRALRHALGCYATGVTIVTTRTPDGGHTGVTVNSFTSVSLDPPLVSFCLDTRSSLLAAFEGASHFTVNILSKDQQALSNRFARPSTNSWDDVRFEIGRHGCAVLPGALSTFECVRRASYPAGDHLILVGEVLCFESGDHPEPLAFFKGKYGTFTTEGQP